MPPADTRQAPAQAEGNDMGWQRVNSKACCRDSPGTALLWLLPSLQTSGQCCCPPRAPSDKSSSPATGRKDTVLLAERHQRDDDFLSVYTFQVGLGKEPHAESPSVLGEHNGILPQPHGARLEAIAIGSTGWEVSLLSLLCETEAESIGRSALLLCGSATSQPRPLRLPQSSF